MMHQIRMKQGIKQNLAFKRKLRSQATFAEKILWLELRHENFKGLKFRRQHGMGPYIVDFYCPEKRLVIEVDGAVHAVPKQMAGDIHRDRQQ